MTHRLIVLAFVILVGCNRPTNSNVVMTAERGNLIVSALDAFMADHGNYPQELTELVPRYLPSIPKPAVGKEWNYSAGPQQDFFALNFTAPGGLPEWTLDSRERGTKHEGWNIDE